MYAKYNEADNVARHGERLRFEDARYAERLHPRIFVPCVLFNARFRQRHVEPYLGTDA